MRESHTRLTRNGEREGFLLACSVTRLALYECYRVTNFLSKLAQIIYYFLGYFEKHHYLKNDTYSCLVHLGPLFERIGLFFS